MGQMGICFVVTPIRYKVGLFLYWFLIIPKHLHVLQQKHAIEAARTNHLHLRCIKIRLWKIRSQRCRLQNWAFLYMLFLENKAQTDLKNYRTMLFMSKEVGLPKISSILQKMKISLKPYICPFCMKAFI